ncbi:MAG: efflux RND transporter permease subunit [Megasphaera sp.]|nr:efflux RND transporter permease subunit [Megasphaera sp.]
MISKFFIDRPIFAVVISLIISILGIISIVTLPVAKYPQVTPPQVRVLLSRGERRSHRHDRRQRYRTPDGRRRQLSQFGKLQ